MILFISAYYQNVNSSKDSSFYINKSIPFLTSNVNKVIFTTLEIYEEIKSYENNLTTFIIQDEPYYYKYINEFTNFKVNGNDKKDTLKYMLLNCSKTNFVKQASMTYPNYEGYAWIDFGIYHVMNNSFQKILFERHNKQLTSGKIRIPGCWDPKFNFGVNFYSDVVWYFCGGFFCCSKDTVVIFSDLMDQKITDMIQKKHIMWEVNIWYLIYLNNKHLFEWYQADHNITMIENF